MQNCVSHVCKSTLVIKHNKAKHVFDIVEPTLKLKSLNLTVRHTNVSSHVLSHCRPKQSAQCTDQGWLSLARSGQCHVELTDIWS